MRYTITILCLMFFAGGAYSGFMAGAYMHGRYDLKTYQAKAIELGCGEYNRTTGEYEDVKAIQPVDVMNLEPLPIEHPVPQRKPRGAK